MKLSPLQLVHSQFTAISVISKEMAQMEPSSADSPYPDVTEHDIKTEITLGLPDDSVDPHDFFILLGISSTDEDAKTIPYRFAAKIEAVFRFDHDGGIEERKRIVVINGASMLYGIIREQILTLTMRQKNGPLLLPSLDFRALSEQSRKEKPKQSRKTIAKKPQ